MKQTLIALLNEKPSAPPPPKLDISEMKFETEQQKQEMDDMISLEKHIQELAVSKSDAKTDSDSEESDSLTEEEEELMTDEEEEEEEIELDDGTSVIIVRDDNEDEYFDMLIEKEKKRDEALAKVIKEQEQANELMILQLLEGENFTQIVDEQKKLLAEFENKKKDEVPKKQPVNNRDDEPKKQPVTQKKPLPSDKKIQDLHVLTASVLEKQLQKLFRKAHRSSLRVEYVVNSTLLSRFKQKLSEIRKHYPQAKPQMVFSSIIILINRYRHTMVQRHQIFQIFLKWD